MVSKVIPYSPVASNGDIKDLISYSLLSVDNQIVLSKDGILYLRRDKSGLIIDNSEGKSEITKKKEKSLFNKSDSYVELSFEFDKVYICYNSAYFYLFCFTRTKDGSVIYTEMDINDFSRIEETSEIKNYAELSEFLYEIDDSYGIDGAGYESFANDNPITGKFIFSNGIEYARYYNSEVILKNPLSEFNKNQINMNFADLQANKKYGFKTETVTTNEENNCNSKSSGLAENILNTVRAETELENESFIDDAEDFGECADIFDYEAKCSITDTVRNYMIITGIDSIEIYAFYVFYSGEDRFKVECQRLDIGSFSDVKRIFSVLQLK